MATVTAYHNDITGGTYYAYPVSQSLGDWATYRVALSEASSPNTGRYSGTLNTATSVSWYVFSGSTQPSTWSLAVAVLDLRTEQQEIADAALLTPTGEAQSLYDKTTAVSTMPINQVPVPKGRTVTLVKTTTGLAGEMAEPLKVGEAKLIAVDFQADMAINQRFASLVEVVIETGTAGGITFDTEADGFDKTLLKFEATGVTEGSYEVRCKVTYSPNSEVAEGIVAFTVI